MYDDANVLNNKGNALSKQGKYDETIECYDKALELRPDYANVLNNKGIALSNQKTTEPYIIPGNNVYPIIFASNNNVNVEWYEEWDGENENSRDGVFSTTSTDNGVTFGQINNISSDTTNPYRHAKYLPSQGFYMSGNNTYVSWIGRKDDLYGILFTISTNNDQNFSTPYNIIANNLDKHNLRLTVSGHNIYNVGSRCSTSSI